MKSKYLLFLLFVPAIIYSQENVWSTPARSDVYDGRSNSGEWAIRTREAYQDLRNNIHRTLSDYEYEKIIGNAYFNKEFSLGKIYIDNDTVNRNFNLRYNAFTDEVEVGNKTSYEVLIKNTDISCSIGKDLYLCRSFTKKKGGDIETGYLRSIIITPQFSFLVRETKVFKEAKKAKNTLTSSFPAKLVDVKKYYFIDKDSNVATLINQKNKKVLEIIDPIYKEEMIRYLKENNLNVKEDKDLESFFKFYSNLIIKESN